MKIPCFNKCKVFKNSNFEELSSCNNNNSNSNNKNKIRNKNNFSSNRRNNNNFKLIIRDNKLDITEIDDDNSGSNNDKTRNRYDSGTNFFGSTQNTEYNSNYNNNNSINLSNKINLSNEFLEGNLLNSSSNYNGLKLGKNAF
ncbi:hypothetical protein DICPUDRAFT_81671 [Dictyostelium purpureum]|uniref:Uncharacterized protein n=1 Tax=Dictyostelium purpureum TaxID=5786 RepID=F0ZU79_DICPU|nr:uncharacterized protein DICPUDRAFT_81671 [Dictyostelium purpureum]EGC32492.1 hypothetical protein DICPUDRAFT_81671 [Dictyostelium purpureum]|eukprot:XP_003290985.1 hypothetical protein DICPUDRAFT_81671 [Dictyostelium purpureum]